MLRSRFKTLLLAIAAASVCACSGPVTSNTSNGTSETATAQTTIPPCPQPDPKITHQRSQLFLYPGAVRIPSKGMATSLNPGLNVAQNHYHVDAAKTDVLAFYAQCLSGVSSKENGHVYEAPYTSFNSFPNGTETLRIQNAQDGGVELIVTCDGCY